ncbi:MAG: hypothetical protein GDA48_14260 [Hormoscilla sp. GM102CHS1]|nr:hypothetical protein [Hormoscilla sp. GM102CHS1]
MANGWSRSDKLQVIAIIVGAAAVIIAAIIEGLLNWINILRSQEKDSVPPVQQEFRPDPPYSSVPSCRF